MSKYLRAGRRTVERSLAVLVAKGLLVRKKKPGRASVIIAIPSEIQQDLDLRLPRRNPCVSPDATPPKTCVSPDAHKVYRNNPIKVNGSGSSLSKMADWQLDRDERAVRQFLTDEKDRCKPDALIIKHHRNRLNAIRDERRARVQV